MVRTMKKMATALQEEHPGSSLVNAFIPGLPCKVIYDDDDDDDDVDDHDDDHLAS